MFHQGQQIGLYSLNKKIGRGGFGEVWLAERQTELLTTLVAVKLPHSEQVNIEAIKQEASLWAKASGHPNVLPIIEANIYDGQVIIASEFAPDGSLEERFESEIVLTKELAIEMAIGILNGLDFLHSRQIIHRDIKPANILLQGNIPRLADFGISRVVKTTGISTAIVGTPSYMSPEAFDGKRNVQTDIWSVGVILHQLLSGKLPFPQENSVELMWAIVSKEPDPLPSTIQYNLQRIVTKALAKNANERYKTAREMKEDLQKVLINFSYPSLKEDKTIAFSNRENQILTVGKTAPALTQPSNEEYFNLKKTEKFPLAETQFSPSNADIISNPFATETRIIAGASLADKKGKEKFIGKLGSSLIFLLIGLIFGAGAYYYWLKSQPQPVPVFETPKITEMQTPNIAYSSFEDNRRNVDKNPEQFIAANGTSAEDAEDFYLLGRANLLIGKYYEAKKAFADAKLLLANYKGADKTMLANEIAIGLSIVDSTFSKKVLEAERNSATTTTTQTPASNTNIANDTEIKPLNEQPQTSMPPVQ